MQCVLILSIIHATAILEMSITVNTHVSVLRKLLITIYETYEILIKILFFIAIEGRRLVEATKDVYMRLHVSHSYMLCNYAVCVMLFGHRLLLPMSWLYFV